MVKIEKKNTLKQFRTLDRLLGLMEKWVII